MHNTYCGPAVPTEHGVDSFSELGATCLVDATSIDLYPFDPSKFKPNHIAELEYLGVASAVFLPFRKSL